MATTKHSKQRDAIRNFLISRKDHPTAEVVYANVSKEFPNISLGTVYRNLSFLVDNGQAVKVPCDNGSDLDFNDSKPEKALVSAAANQFDGIIEGSVSFFYGKCPKCSKKQK